MCGARLLLTTVSTYLVDWVCFCHLIKTQYCCLCPSGRYNLPLATQLPLPPTHPPPKPNLASIVIKHKLNNYCSYAVNLAWLQPSRWDSQRVKYFKLVILKIPNVWFGLVILKPVTYYVLLIAPIGLLVSYITMYMVMIYMYALIIQTRIFETYS